jgi:hypothetical protein
MQMKLAYFGHYTFEFASAFRFIFDTGRAFAGLSCNDPRVERRLFHCGAMTRGMSAGFASGRERVIRR